MIMVKSEIKPFSNLQHHGHHFPGCLDYVETQQVTINSSALQQFWVRHQNSLDRAKKHSVQNMSAPSQSGENSMDVTFTFCLFMWQISYLSCFSKSRMRKPFIWKWFTHLGPWSMTNFYLQNLWANIISICCVPLWHGSMKDIPWDHHLWPHLDMCLTTVNTDFSGGGSMKGQYQFTKIQSCHIQMSANFWAKHDWNFLPSPTGSNR